MASDWIQTYTGIQFYPTHPEMCDIHILDIAHALAMQCRFAGHVRQFYSVAEHSVRVSHACDPEDAMWGLLHDASEAYLGDVTRPLKRDDLMTGYLEAENVLQAMIARRFWLSPGEPASVKVADEWLLATEARDLKSPLHPEWVTKWLTFDPLPEVIVPWSPERAECEFMRRYAQLAA